MRTALPMIAVLGLFAACANEPREVSATAPSVSYQVTGNDLSHSNASAARYCQQYGAAARLQGVQPSGSGSVTTYACDGAASSNASTTPYYGSSMAPAVQCADLFHQDRPGGSDYRGPRVTGCPQPN
jgi:hypothetical protein